MKGYRKILIAVNGSKKVLRQGLRLASDEKTWVTVVKVIPQNEGDLNITGIKNIQDVLDGCSRQERAEISRIAQEEGALVKTKILEGEAHEKILEAAEEERCDVIVMGAGRKSWLSRLFGDNTVEKVIRGSDRPVLVVAA